MKDTRAKGTTRVTADELADEAWRGCSSWVIDGAAMRVRAEGEGVKPR